MAGLSQALCGRAATGAVAGGMGGGEAKATHLLWQGKWV